MNNTKTNTNQYDCKEETKISECYFILDKSPMWKKLKKEQGKNFILEDETYYIVQWISSLSGTGGSPSGTTIYRSATFFFTSSPDDKYYGIIDNVIHPYDDAGTPKFAQATIQIDSHRKEIQFVANQITGNNEITFDGEIYQVYKFNVDYGQPI